MADNVLHTWKEIAQYAGCGVRTVQRWELMFGLPVRRPSGRLRSSVIAYRGEIDAWFHQRRMRFETVSTVRTAAFTNGVYPGSANGHSEGAHICPMCGRTGQAEKNIEPAKNDAEQASS